jgi:hypothetical protein
LAFFCRWQDLYTKNDTGENFYTQIGHETFGVDEIGAVFFGAASTKKCVAIETGASVLDVVIPVERSRQNGPYGRNTDRMGERETLINLVERFPLGRSQ